jgi:hypothetical protein
MSDCTTPMHIE